MPIISRYPNILLVIALGFDMGGSRRLGAEERVVPSAVKDALVRYANLKTFSVTWTQQSELTDLGRAKFGLRGPRKPSPPHVCYLVWQGGKMYMRRNEGGREWKDGPDTRRDEFAFDGRILAGGCPDQLSTTGRARKPGLVIDLASDKDADAEYFGVESFQPMGIHFPHGVGELLKVKFLESQVLFLLEHGGQVDTLGPGQIDGRPMTRVVVLADNPRLRSMQKIELAVVEQTLRNSGTYTEAQIQEKLEIAKRTKETTPRKLQYAFYLDPQLGYAVRRSQELTESGQLRSESNCTGHTKLAGLELWVPRNCRTDNYISGNFPGEIFEAPFQSILMEVSQFDTKAVPEEQFTLNYTVPGTDVTDNTLPEGKLGKGGVSYKIPANPEYLDRAIEEARALTRARAQRDNWRITLKTVILVGNTIALTVLLVYVVIRYRRKVANS